MKAALLKASRKVENPELTPAQGAAVWEDEVRRADMEGRAYNFDVNKVWRDENILSRIGALAYIKRPRRRPHHEEAAARFKNMYEGCFGSGGAVDPGKEPVDTSLVAHDNGILNRIADIRTLDALKGRVGKAIYDRLVAQVVLCVPCAEYCRTTPSGQVNKRDEARAVKWLLMTLELVSAIWGIRPLPA